MIFGDFGISELGWTGELWLNRVRLPPLDSETSSGRIASSQYWKNKRVDFFSGKIFSFLQFFFDEKSDFFRFFEIFSDFFLRIWLDWRALVKSRSPNIEKARVFFSCKKIFFKNLGFLWKKVIYFLRIFEYFEIFRIFFVYFKYFWVSFY